jgi:hypothetical protein
VRQGQVPITWRREAPTAVRALVPPLLMILLMCTPYPADPSTRRSPTHTLQHRLSGSEQLLGYPKGRGAQVGGWAASPCLPACESGAGCTTHCAAK